MIVYGDFSGSLSLDRTAFQSPNRRIHNLKVLTT